MAGLIISDSLIKKFGGSLGNANENIELRLPYSVKIEPVKIDPSKNKSVKNSSTKRKHADISRLK